MNNYKIKVNNEAESKEAQELFFELGYEIECFVASRFPRWLATTDHGEEYWYSTGYEIEAPLNGFQELTIPQLRDLVSQSKNEQDLISGADALRALADGKEVEYLYGENNWLSVIEMQVMITAFTGSKFKFRLKPRTIKLEIEIPACGTNYKHGQLIWVLNSLEPKEYCSVILDESDELPAYWWSTEEQVKQVVAALRGGIKG